MSVWTDIIGTISTKLQIGIGGVILRNDSETLLVMDSSNIIPTNILCANININEEGGITFGDTLPQTIMVGSSLQNKIEFYANNTLLGQIDVEGIISSKTVRTAVYTVATLPGAPIAGMRAMVSNALTPAFGAIVTGGGAVVMPVYYDGANWRCG